MRKTFALGIAGVFVGVLAGCATAPASDSATTGDTNDACREAVGLYQQEEQAFAQEHGEYAAAAQRLSETGDVTAFLESLATTASDTNDVLGVIHPQAADAAAQCLGDGA